MATIVYTDEVEGVALQFGFDTEHDAKIGRDMLDRLTFWMGYQVDADAEPAIATAPIETAVKPEPKRRKRRTKAEMEAEKERIANGEDPQPPKDFADIVGAPPEEDLIGGTVPTVEEMTDMVRAAIGAGTLSGDNLAEFLKAHGGGKVVNLDDAGRAALAAKIMESPSGG